jgi:[ribosomal protein S5]-alanine N-acetyltransferase
LPAAPRTAHAGRRPGKFPGTPPAAKFRIVARGNFRSVVGVILETERLVVRELTLTDAPFALELLNEPAFHRYIGDKGIRDLAGAGKYLREGPLASYAQPGHGLWQVALKATGEPVGINGQIKRPVLPDVDLGFAFLARHQGKGYGYESSVAILRHGRDVLKLPAVIALTAPENPASIGLLEKLGFRFDRMIDLPGYATPSRLFKLGD